MFFLIIKNYAKYFNFILIKLTIYPIIILQVNKIK
ncbi:unnamed protein product [Spirodela intermedia]|uniref:Uncharacterized protein n=1 Tax=Spirodela intermedia TaxID=51605 RepID=A0A7I8J2U5_SPIIN|nr:unnamed protein product [Spirodela intermedia]CAA6664379.1 unnamed protein product [Spirodela intermedia]